MQPSIQPDRIVHSAEFKRLVLNRWSVSLVLSLLMMGAYFGFIFVIATRGHVLALRIGQMPLGIYLGLSLIVSAWLLTGIYTYWANRFYDDKVERMRAQALSQGEQR